MTAAGKLTPEQEAWGAALAAVAAACAQDQGGPVVYRVIRPAQWIDGSVERLLRGEEAGDGR